MDPEFAELVMEAQYDFPIVDRPFEELGKRLGKSESWVMDALSKAKERNQLRRIGALTNYKARKQIAALVGLRVPLDRVDRVASAINLDKTVTHNFLRDHPRYSIWYVTKAPTTAELESKVRKIVDEFSIEDHVILYAERTYKIDVKFDVLRGVSRAKMRIIPETVPTIEDTGLPRQFFDSIRSIKIVERPFDEAAAIVDMPVGKLVDLLSDLRQRGVVRDFYAMFDPDAVGIRENSMVVFNATDAQCEGAALIDESTHVVKRIPVPGKWDYNCYFMIHAASKEILEETVRKRLGELGVGEYRLVYSLRNLLYDMGKRIEG
ncbi:heme biosynthesis protein [Thermocladium modestius]|uniref:siroheme decarboxylase n=1 Tax=Thermocladium modestius TaxID=62609 RepID=A0A830GVJ7_9CREN|nr:Lrp/AsnC family transcriptional regulator [Thermocladium modestius]GGP19143.1 heme biosynthesis protein [Thermocladium modestius]